MYVLDATSSEGSFSFWEELIGTQTRGNHFRLL